MDIRWAVVVAAACSSGDSGTEEQAPAPVPFEVDATAGPRFTADDAPSTRMVHGPQDGWHVWVSAAVSGPIDTIRAEVSVVDLDRDEVLAPARPWNVRLLADETACGDAEGVCGTFCEHEARFDPANQDLVCDVAGHTLEITVEVGELGEELTASDTITVVAELDPQDVTRCLRR